MARKPKNFSERIGINVRTTFQLRDMDLPLRTGLWNCFERAFLVNLRNQTVPFQENSRYFPFLCDLWDQISRPIFSMPPYSDPLINHLSQWFFDAKWNEVYDFIDFIGERRTTVVTPVIDGPTFRARCNAVLERELSGYRFVDDKLAPITNPEEIKSIEDAIKAGQRLAGVEAASNHLEKALDLLADREKPDFKNSIKESISAVEALCRKLVGENKTLGDALKAVQASGTVKIHPALVEGFKRVYGYTSDAAGIRHGEGIGDTSDTDAEDARFMLVSCSAFVNYLISKAQKAGMSLS
jgi:hypothetical protein